MGETPNIKIRKAEESDFPAMISLFREFAEFQKHPERMQNTVAHMREEKDYIFAFLALSEPGEIIAYACYSYTYHTWSGKSIYLDDLYVKPRYRKIGLGKRLLEKVIDEAKRENCHKVRWQVSHWNKNAQEFYKSMGAEIDGEELNCDLVLRK